MPLIILTGLPTSGKSTRAKQLHDYLSERIGGTKYRLHLISDDSLSISRTVYDLCSLPAHTRSANASEKDARATIYGAVKRVLSDKDIVILDGLNYIKGWRYQLHCEAKAVRTPSCILQIGCSPDCAKQVNEERLGRREAVEAQEGDTAEPYEPGTQPHDPLGQPLFTVIWEDDEDQVRKTFESMWEAIAGDGRKVIRPNQATEQRGRDASGDYLYVLDRETQDIVKRILSQQGDDGGADVSIPLSSGKGDLVIELPAGRKVGLPELQRHRRAFVGLNRGGIGLEKVTNMGADTLKESFVNYLNNTFEQGD
ncbi:Protein kti12 [Cladobotryum mycophilum]|uniref:Protein kti12 n=1 Tax=Cladobotryum mycophilum TaxID=491253 RepID=A0ABR0SAH8_9HYPO